MLHNVKKKTCYKQSKLYMCAQKKKKKLICNVVQRKEAPVKQHTRLALLKSEHSYDKQCKFAIPRQTEEIVSLF